MLTLRKTAQVGGGTLHQELHHLFTKPWITRIPSHNTYTIATYK
jgi:hypothetical protein